MMADRGQSASVPAMQSNVSINLIAIQIIVWRKFNIECDRFYAGNRIELPLLFRNRKVIVNYFGKRLPYCIVIEAKTLKLREIIRYGILHFFLHLGGGRIPQAALTVKNPMNFNRLLKLSARRVL